MKLKKINKIELRIAFDGFSASGKSLGAKLISKKYNLKLLNSGLLYRYAAFLILKNKIQQQKKDIIIFFNNKKTHPRWRFSSYDPIPPFPPNEAGTI